MADSRRASLLQMKQMERKVENQTRVIQFLVSILLSLLAVELLRDPSFHSAQIYVLFLLFFSIGLWVTEAIPPFAVGIFIVGFLVFFLGQPAVADEEAINVKKFVNTWSNSVIWLLLGGFFLAEGIRKTGLDLDIFRLASSRFIRHPSRLLLALMLGTAISSMVMSNTATTAMMLTAVMPLILLVGKDSPYAKAVLLGIPAAASVGGVGTIIGSPPNAVAVEMINRMEGIPFQITFFRWMIIGVPVAILMTVSFWFLLTRKFKVPAISDKLLPALESGDEEELDEVDRKEARSRKNIVLSVLGLTLLLWVTDGLHPIPMAAVSGIPIIALTMLNILSGEDVRSLPWDTLMLVAGSLSLGLAIQETALDEYFISKLQGMTLAFGMLVALFALVTVFASNIMSNTAAVTILIPAASLLEVANPMVLPLIIGLSASFALMLPVSTPPNAIAFSTGLLQQKDFRLGGTFMGLVGPLLIIGWVFLILSVIG